MKILFLVYHGFSKHSGISKKIRYQVKGLKENGHDVRLCYYGFAKNNHRCRYIDDKVLQDYGIGKWAGLRQRISYTCIYNYCIREKIEFVYARCFMNANPWLIHFFKKIKEAGIHAVTEIPTFPYDGEFAGATGQQRLGFMIDKTFRKRLYHYMDAMVTFSDAMCIFGQHTINISNGVDFDSIPLHLYNKSPRNIFFHIVGGIWSGDLYGSKFAPGIQTLINQYHLEDKVILHGQLFGQALDDIFNKCVFAIGSLGRHRNGITVIKTLKNREYATRGFPFIYSESDSDFDQQPYVLKAPADESPIDIQSIIDFIDNFKMQPMEIRNSVQNLTWKIQMQKVVDAINIT